MALMWDVKVQDDTQTLKVDNVTVRDLVGVEKLVAVSLIRL